MSARTPEHVYADVVSTVLAALRGRGGFDSWWDDVDESTRTEIVCLLEARVKHSVGVVVEAVIYAAEVDQRLTQGDADADDLIRACERCAKALKDPNDAR